MKKFLCMTMLCGFLTASFVHPTYAAIHSNVPSDVEKFAQKDGVAEAKKLLSIAPSDIGLSSKDEVEQLTLGPGMQIHTIDSDKLQKSTSHSLLSVIKPEQEWEFILEKNGQAITSIIIGKENGSYSLQRVGGDSSNFLSSWEKFDTHVASKAEPTLILDKNVRFLVGTVENQEVAIPDLSGNRYLKLNNVNPLQVSPASEIAKALKDDLEKNLKNQYQSEPQFGSGSNLSVQSSPASNHYALIAMVVGIVGLLGVGSFRLTRKKS